MKRQGVKEKMKIAGKQVASAREMIGITQGELALAAGVGKETVVRFESGASIYEANVNKIRAALEARGIEFSNGPGMGVRLNYAKAEEFARQTRSG